MSTKAAGQNRSRNSVQASAPVLGFDSPHDLLAAEAATQWGMFTTGQALRAGMSRKALSHLVARRHVDHTSTRGVYRFAGAPVDTMLDQTRGNWLALSPKLFLRERLKALRDDKTWNDAIVSHLTAVNYVHVLANTQPESCEFVVNKNRRVRDPSIHFYPRREKPRWEIVDGLPVTTIAQTIADLYADDLDQDHLGQIVYDAMLRRGHSLHDIAAGLDQVTDNGRATALRLLELVNTPAEFIAANDVLFNLGRK